MELSGGALVIVLTFGLAAFLGIVIALVIWAGLYVFAARAIVYLFTYVVESVAYLFDRRRAELPDTRPSRSVTQVSRAPRVRRDPAVQAEAARAVAQRRRRDRRMVIPRVLLALLLAVLIALWLIGTPPLDVSRF